MVQQLSFPNDQESAFLSHVFIILQFLLLDHMDRGEYGRKMPISKPPCPMSNIITSVYIPFSRTNHIANLIVPCYKQLTKNCLFYIFSACALESIPFRSDPLFQASPPPFLILSTIGPFPISRLVKKFWVDSFSLKIITFFLTPVFHILTIKCIFYLTPSQSDSLLIMAFRMLSNCTKDPLVNFPHSCSILSLLSACCTSHNCPRPLAHTFIVQFSPYPFWHYPSHCNIFLFSTVNCGSVLGSLFVSPSWC